MLAERLADLRDVDMHQVIRGLRRARSPELVDEVTRRHDLVGTQQQDREESCRLAGGEQHRPLPVYGLERPEDAELHRGS